MTLSYLCSGTDTLNLHSMSNGEKENEFSKDELTQGPTPDGLTLSRDISTAGNTSNTKKKPHIKYSNSRKQKQMKSKHTLKLEPIHQSVY